MTYAPYPNRAVQLSPHPGLARWIDSVLRPVFSPVDFDSDVNDTDSPLDWTPAALRELADVVEALEALKTGSLVSLFHVETLLEVLLEEFTSDLFPLSEDLDSRTHAAGLVLLLRFAQSINYTNSNTVQALVLELTSTSTSTTAR